MPDETSEPDSSESNHSASYLAGKQYVAELLRELEAVDSELLRGRDRFPADSELSYAPAQFRSILAIAKEAISQWDQLDPEVANGIEAALMQMMDIVATVEALQREAEEDMYLDQRRGASEQVRTRLQEIQNFFRDTVEPIANADASKGSSTLAEEELRLAKEEIQRSKREIAELEARSSQIDAELESRKELIEAARTGAGSAGAEDLANAYEDQGRDHNRQWKIWGAALGAALATALGGGYLILKLNAPPEKATTASLISHLAVDLLVVGLLIYAVRVTSLQFSVHRHLAAVANNKAAALKTFARIVSSGSSAETRDRLAEVLAHHVFISESTGFLDAAGDQVTLPERVVAPVAQRINGS
jgi:hypothetical protein